jgi:hypothetical protein
LAAGLLDFGLERHAQPAAGNSPRGKVFAIDPVIDRIRGDPETRGDLFYA